MSGGLWAKAGLLAVLVILVGKPEPALADGLSKFVVDARGARVEVIEDLPSGVGPFATLILAPGAGYDMRQPLLNRLAHALITRNIAVIRFNWTYFTADPAHGQASADLTAEVKNMQAVVSLARSEARLDSNRMVVAGKSLGSVVSFAVLEADPGFRG